MQYIISQCKPLSVARYVVFRSYQYTDGDEFYEVLDLEIVKHPQTILSYEMNGEPLDLVLMTHHAGMSRCRDKYKRKRLTEI